MTSILSRMYDELGYKFNDVIKHGMAKDDMDCALDDIILLLESTSKSEGNRLEFLGARYLDPIEEIRYLFNKKKTIEADIAPSSFKMAVFNFLISIDGKETLVDKYTYIPAPTINSTMAVNGHWVYLKPIWTDPLLAPKPTGVGLFSKLYKNKTDVGTKPFLVHHNNVRKQKSIIFMRDFYKTGNIKSRIDPALKDIETPLALLLLYRYNISEVVKIGNGVYGENLIIEVLPYENGSKKYPKPELREGYTVLSGTGKQSKLRSGICSERHSIVIYIKDGSSFLIYELAYALMFAFELFPDTGTEAVKVIGTSDEHYGWMNVIIMCLFRGAYHGARKVSLLNEHMAKTNSYIDKLVQRDMKDEGYDVKNIYDYIIVIINNYNSMTKAAIDGTTNVFQKRLQVRYYLLFNLISSINRSLADINYQLERGDNLSAKHIAYKLKDTFKPKLLFTAMNQVLPKLPISSTNDNRAFSETCVVDIQERGDGPYIKVNKGRMNMPNNLKALKASHFVMGDGLNLYKGAPSPLLRLPPMVTINDNKAIVSKEMKAYIAKLDIAFNKKR